MTPIERQILESQRVVLVLLSNELKDYGCRKCSGFATEEHGLYCKEYLVEKNLEKIDNLLSPKGAEEDCCKMGKEVSEEKKKKINGLLEESKNQDMSKIKEHFSHDNTKQEGSRE